MVSGPVAQLDDRAQQALANVLTTPGHDNQTYDIAPGPAYSFQDVARTLSEAAGQGLSYRLPSGYQVVWAGGTVWDC